MTPAEQAIRERKLRALGVAATDAKTTARHAADPLLALMRGGDHSEDLNDAIAHVSQCALCRARLSEGVLSTRSLVVVAIEASRAVARKIEHAAERASARLIERGNGRWAAVVDARKLDNLRGELEEPEPGLIRRFEVGTPFDVTIEQKRARKAYNDIPDAGTDAAEIQVWAQMSKRPARAAGVSIGWTLFAIIAIAGAAAIAYWLATRP